MDDQLAEEVIKCLEKGYFFNPKEWGIKRVKTVESVWRDPVTEVRTLKHLFSKVMRKINMPSPSNFAIMMGSLGWWTTDLLYKRHIGEYRNKVAKVKAKFLTTLSDPYVLRRFQDVASLYGRGMEELLDSIFFRILAKKIKILEANEDQTEDIVNRYTRAIDGRVKDIILKLGRLLRKGVFGRKMRIRELAKSFALLTELNAANYRSQLIRDLGVAFDSIQNLERKSFPDLGKYLDEEDMSKELKGVLQELIAFSEDITMWRMK